MKKVGHACIKLYKYLQIIAVEWEYLKPYNCEQTNEQWQKSTVL